MLSIISLPESTSAYLSTASPTLLYQSNDLQRWKTMWQLMSTSVVSQPSLHHARSYDSNPTSESYIIERKHLRFIFIQLSLQSSRRIIPFTFHIFHKGDKWLCNEVGQVLQPGRVPFRYLNHWNQVDLRSGLLTVTYLDCLKNQHRNLTRDGESWNKLDFIGQTEDVSGYIHVVYCRRRFVQGLPLELCVSSAEPQ